MNSKILIVYRNTIKREKELQTELQMKCLQLRSRNIRQGAICRKDVFHTETKVIKKMNDRNGSPWACITGSRFSVAGNKHLASFLLKHISLVIDFMSLNTINHFHNFYFCKIATPVIAKTGNW